MKQLFFIVAVSVSLGLGSCKKIKAYFSKDEKAKADAAMKQLETKMKEDSIKYLDELARMKAESSATIDSLQSTCVTKKTMGSGKYYVVTGAFMEAGYAEKYQAKMENEGFPAQVIDAGNGFSLVAVKSTNSLSDAVSAMEDARGAITENAWVYIAQ